MQKSNADLVQALEAYRVVDLLRIPHCLDSRLTDGGKLVSSKHRPHSTPQNIIFLFLVLISVRSWVSPQSLVRPEWVGKLEKFIHLIEFQRMCHKLLPKYSDTSDPKNLVLQQKAVKATYASTAVLQNGAIFPFRITAAMNRAPLGTHV
jgi:hypothetical protein